MSDTLITIPPPGQAVAQVQGVGSYRTESVSLSVAQDGQGRTALTVQIGEAVATLSLDIAAWGHLIRLLTENAPAEDLTDPAPDASGAGAKSGALQ